MIICLIREGICSLISAEVLFSLKHLFVKR